MHGPQGRDAVSQNGLSILLGESRLLCSRLRTIAGRGFQLRHNSQLVLFPGAAQFCSEGVLPLKHAVWFCCGNGKQFADSLEQGSVRIWNLVIFSDVVT